MLHLILDATSAFFYLTLLLALLVDGVALISVINRDASPEYKLSWAVVVLTLPLLGAILYAIFYRRRITGREERLLRGIFGQLNTHRSGEDSLDLLSAHSADAGGKARAIIHDDPIAELYINSSSDYFDSGEGYFKSMLCDLRSATDFIFLEYFIVADGSLWDSIHEILRQKAAEGVEIRLIYDDFGCMSTLPGMYDRSLRSEGINAVIFGRISPRMSSVHNNRDHRKICVIDGRIGYTGGVNIADEYVNHIVRFGHWKDGGIRLRGDAVRGLIKEFLSDWDFSAGTVSDYGRYLDCVTATDESDGGFYLPFGSGPMPIYPRPSGKNTFLNLINQAKDYLYITTPYLIIDHELTAALCNAAVRGVDLRIITPGIPDKKHIRIMTRSSYPTLIGSGVRIYEYTPGFIHEKCLVCDGEYAVVGTINFDYRSFNHNFENAVWMYNTPTVEQVRAGLLSTLNACNEIKKESCRLTLKEWIIRNGIRLFAPLL